MVAGISGGVVFAGGDRLSFLIGALCYGLANILDCCDGMIARLKKNGTMTGRIVDGCTDYIIGAAVYSGFAIGLSRAVHTYGMRLPCNSWILMILATISFAAHAVMSDKFRNAFLLRKRHLDQAPDDESEKFKEELKRLEGIKGSGIDKLLIRVYLRYIRLQSGYFKASHQKKESSGARPLHPAMVVFWNLIGPSTHVLFLMLSAMLYSPMPFFIYVIGAANLWMIILIIISNRQATPK